MNSEASGCIGESEAVLRQTLEKSAGKKPDIKVFLERAKAVGAYEYLSERERVLMDAYFTTPATYEELQSLAGGVSGGRVRQIIERGYRKVWHRLPPEIQQEYSKVKGDHTFPMRPADFEKPKKLSKIAP